MKNYICFLALIIAITLCFPAYSAELPCRYSGDYSQSFLYLTKNIAINKSTEILGDGSIKTSFRIGKAHWLNDPELASQTGDVLDDENISKPRQVGISDDKKWLVAEVRDRFDFKANRKIPVYYCALSLVTGKGYSEEDITKLKKMTGDDSITKIRLEPTEMFFDRLLISRLEKDRSVTK